MEFCENIGAKENSIFESPSCLMGLIEFESKPTQTQREETNYLKRAIGKPLREALVDVTLKRPRDPISHISTYIRQYAHNIRDLVKKEVKKEEEKRILEEEIDLCIKLSADIFATKEIENKKELLRIKAEEEERKKDERERSKKMRKEVIKENLDLLYAFDEIIGDSLSRLENENIHSQKADENEEGLSRDK